MICHLRHRTTAFNYNDITDVGNLMEEKLEGKDLPIKITNHSNDSNLCYNCGNRKYIYSYNLVLIRCSYNMLAASSIVLLFSYSFINLIFDLHKNMNIVHLRT